MKRISFDFCVNNTILPVVWSPERGRFKPFPFRVLQVKWVWRVSSDSKVRRWAEWVNRKFRHNSIWILFKMSIDHSTTNSFVYSNCLWFRIIWWINVENEEGQKRLFHAATASSRPKTRRRRRMTKNVCKNANQVHFMRFLTCSYYVSRHCLPFVSSLHDYARNDDLSLFHSLFFFVVVVESDDNSSRM